MPWHIKQKCLPAIPPSGLIGACDDCGPQLDYAPRRFNRDTAWRGYIDARERFKEAYDHLHNLRQAYGPDFRCNDASCRLCSGRGTRSAQPIVDVKGVCQYCRGVGSSPYCYCSVSYNTMTGFGRSYGYDDPAMWDPFWCNCSGTPAQVAPGYVSLGPSVPAPAVAAPLPAVPTLAPAVHYVTALPPAVNPPPPVVPGGLVPMHVHHAAAPITLANGAVQTTSESETQQIVFVQAGSKSKAYANAHVGASGYGAQRHPYYPHALYLRGKR